MSNYRDDREALHQRIGQLEQELIDARRDGQEQGRDEAQARAAALQQRLTDMQGELANMESELAALRGRKPKPPAKGVALGAVGVVAFVVFAFVSMRSSPTVVSAPPPPPAVTPAPPPPEPPVASATPLFPMKPTPDPRSTKARWFAKATRIEGLTLGPGATCQIEATIHTNDTNALVDDLEVHCNGQKLYRSSDALNGMAQMSNDARELLGDQRAADDKSSFTLAYRDIGSRTGERTQVDIDTTKQQGTVFRETIPRFRVDFSVPSASVPTTPMARRLRRAGTVAAVTGAAPVTTGTPCVLRALATGQHEHCVAEVVCRSAVLFPKSAPVTCTYESSLPSTLSTGGGEPGMSMDDTTLTVTGKGFSVKIELDDPNKRDD
jgi:hypothetical protein